MAQRNTAERISTRSSAEVTDPRPTPPPVPAPAPAGDPGQPGGPPSSAPATRDGRRAVVVTTAVSAAAGVAGHVVLLLGWLGRSAGQVDNLYPWQPVVGASLAAVALVSFGGYYYASLRARVAIMASFLATFLLLLTYVLTVREMQPGAAATLVDAVTGDFRVIVQTIIGFYFGTETVLSLTKIIRAPAGDAAAVRRADRDLPAG